MSLMCEHRGGCVPDATGQYPPDCAYQTGAGGGIPYGNDMVVPGSSSSGATKKSAGGLAGVFGEMSTTTLLLIGGAVWFLFFRKK